MAKRKPDRIDRAAASIAGLPRENSSVWLDMNSSVWLDMTTEEIHYAKVTAKQIAALVRREVKRERKAPPAPSVNDELLDACELALEELHGYADAGGSVKAWNICEHLRAVIAKAREAGR